MTETTSHRVRLTVFRTRWERRIWIGRRRWVVTLSIARREDD